MLWFFGHHEQVAELDACLYMFLIFVHMAVYRLFRCLKNQRTPPLFCSFSRCKQWGLLSNKTNDKVLYKCTCFVAVVVWKQVCVFYCCLKQSESLFAHADLEPKSCEVEMWEWEWIDFHRPPPPCTPVCGQWKSIPQSSNNNYSNHSSKQ